MTVRERADIVPLLAEIFRALGYDGASLSRITAQTGLGKGSLYHFFPGGKAEMAAAVLDAVDAWFAREVFAPLDDDTPQAGIARMLAATERYFRSGERVCLMGTLAQSDTRDRFAQAIAGYFRRWIDSLQKALQRGGADATVAHALAEETVLAIQGALVLARATGNTEVFTRMLARQHHRLLAA